MKTAIIMPTRGRVQQAARVCAQFLDTAPTVQVVVVSEDADVSPFKAIPNVSLVVPDGEPTAIEKWNLGMAAFPDCDVYGLGADDIEPLAGWYEGLLALLDTGAGMVGMSDGRVSGWQFVPHYCMTREFIITKHGGVMAVPHYQSWYIDLEARHRAERARAYAWQPGCTWIHRHHVFGTAPNDETYMRGQARQAHDRETFARRLAAGFPDDFDPILKQVT